MCLSIILVNWDIMKVINASGLRGFPTSLVRYDINNDKTINSLQCTVAKLDNRDAQPEAQPSAHIKYSLQLPHMLGG